MKKIPISFILYQDDSSTFQKFLPKRLYLNGNTTLFEKKKIQKLEWQIPRGILPIMTWTERFRPNGLRYMKIVGISLSEVQECLICGKWEISYTKPVNPLAVGDHIFWRLLSRVSGLNLGPHGSVQQICDSREQGLNFEPTVNSFMFTCDMISHRYFETVVGLCCLFSFQYGPFHGFLNFWHGQGRENPSTPLERAPQC